MSLSSVLFLFLAHLGVGIAFTLVFVSREAGVKFFRFNAGLSAILLVIALAFADNRLSAGLGAVSIDPSFVTLVATAALMVFYWATVGRILTRIRPAILMAAVISGLIAVALQGLSLGAGRSWPMVLLIIASFLSSAALLGGACTAMILGHWYLILPSMQVSHLQSIVKLHIGSMVVRVVVVAAAVFFAIATWQPGLGPSFRHYITSIDGIFFWQRVLFGLAGPALLSYLTWETAKIQSTQSATGILYVDFFTVVVGEVLAKYILLATRVPV
jgi:protein NrfD